MSLAYGPYLPGHLLLEDQRLSAHPDPSRGFNLFFKGFVSWLQGAGHRCVLGVEGEGGEESAKHSWVVRGKWRVRRAKSAQVRQACREHVGKLGEQSQLRILPYSLTAFQTLQVLDNFDLGNFLGSFREMKVSPKKKKEKKP